MIKRHLIFLTELLFIPLLLIFLFGCEKPVWYLKGYEQTPLRKIDKTPFISALKEESAQTLFKTICNSKKSKKIYESLCQKAQLKDALGALDIYAIESERSLLTGYFEPNLEGSLTKSKEYPYALYEPPRDMVTINLGKQYEALKKYRLRGRLVGDTVVPYATRELLYYNDNNEHNLTPLCFVHDDFERFILEVQGSGRVHLDDNSTLFVGYANQNGWPYDSIGKWLIQQGYLTKKEATLDGIANWIKKNPSRQKEILSVNRSVVFFKKKQRPATGALGIALIANASLAVDPRYIPLGALLIIEYSDPFTAEKITRVVGAMDTGGAIKGVVRGDLFCGFGKEARRYASHMKQGVKMALVLPSSNVKEVQ